MENHTISDCLENKWLAQKHKVESCYVMYQYNKKCLKVDCLSKVHIRNNV